MRFALVTVVVVAFAAVLLPSAVAQSTYFTVEFQPPEQIVLLDDNGTGRAEIGLRMVASGFVCATPATYTFAARLDGEFAPWAGGEVEPSQVSYTIPAGGPGPNAYQQSGEKFGLRLGWDVDNASVQGNETYTVRIAGLSISGGPCIPQATTVGLLNQATVTVCLPPAIGGPTGHACTPGPMVSASFDGSGQTPHPTGLALISILVIAAGVRRRDSLPSRRYHKK